MDPAKAAGIDDPYEAHVFTAALLHRADERAAQEPEDPEDTMDRLKANMDRAVAF